MMSAALIAARLVHDSALSSVFGALLFPFYGFGSADRAGGHAALRRLRPVLATAAGLALASGVAWYGAVAAEMSGDPAGAFKPDVLALVATGSDFGLPWIARLALIAVLTVFLTLRPSDRLRIAEVALAALALGSLAMTGHAREGGGVQLSVHVAADVLHLLGAGLWIGALPCLLLLLAQPSQRALALAAVPRFSAVATPVVAALLLTGALNTLLIAGSPLTLPGSSWGQLLILKVAIVVAMCGLAALNRWRVTPQLGTLTGSRQLARNAVVEMVLATVVIAIVAVLGTLAPMGDM